MAKLINVLAASIGGGLIVGAGLRMLDGASAARSENSEKPVAARNYSRVNDNGLSARLAIIEDRLDQLNQPSPASFTGAAEESVNGLTSRLDIQRGEMEAIRNHLSAADRGIAEAKERGEKSEREARKWTAEEIARQLAGAQTRLQRDIDHSRRETLDAFAEHIQDRVMQRIAKLEEEVASQSSAMVELRECSFKTEQSLQKLLEGIDRLVAAQTVMRSAQASAGDDPGATRLALGRLLTGSR